MGLDFRIQEAAEVGQYDYPKSKGFGRSELHEVSKRTWQSANGYGFQRTFKLTVESFLRLLLDEENPT